MQRFHDVHREGRLIGRQALTEAQVAELRAEGFTVTPAFHSPKTTSSGRTAYGRDEGFRATRG